MTIPLDPRFIPAFSIEDVLLDKDTGAPLTGGLVYFEQDNQRGTLKPVYQITGTSPNYSFTQLPNPVVLSAIGTFEDSLDNPTIPYFYPYDANGNVELYYVRVTSSADVPQFTRQAQPYIQSTGSTSVTSAFENELSNPQFAEVSFDTSSSTYVYNFNAAVQEVVNIAPDWDIVVSSTATGTVTVSQLTPLGSLNILTNPGTILTINSAGLSRLRLRQRLYGSPNLWGSGFLAGTFLAKTFSGTNVTLTLYYSQSNGAVVDEAIVTATLLADGVYAAHPGSIAIPASDSIQSFPNAYVDIEFDIPLSVQIAISSVMVSMTGAVSVNNIVYDQQSQNRQIDHLFHYYKPQLEFKPIPSLLTAWDFPLNPAQALGTSLNITTTAAYTWDQTICQSVVGNIAVVRSAWSSGFQATTANANEAFYLLQYLDGGQAREVLGNKLAVNINAFRSQAGGAVTCKVYLYVGQAASVFPVLGAAGSIGGATPLAANGVFTKNNTAAQGLNWSLIPRSNLGTASGTLSVVSTGDYTQVNDVQDLNFNGWEMDDSALISDTTKFAIVVTFSCPTTGTVVTVDSIGLMKGDIATRPAPQTPDEVLTDCQYYWQKSYSPNVIPGTAVAGAPLFATQQAVTSGGNTVLQITGFGFHFPSAMRTTNPTITLYTPIFANTPNFVDGNVATGTPAGSSGSIASSNWTEIQKSSTGVSFIANNFASTFLSTAGTTFQNAWIYYHFTANGRLGEVI